MKFVYYLDTCVIFWKVSKLSSQSIVPFYNDIDSEPPNSTQTRSDKRFN